MPSGVYERKLPSTYKGFPRLRQEKRGEGSVPIVAGVCSVCGASVERSAKALKLAVSEGRGFCCAVCHGAKRRKGKL